jgi:hypothetical protein
MLHPTEEAEDYIWENFMNSYFDKDTTNFVKEWSSIQSSLSHKPFHPQSLSHQKFLKQTLIKLGELKSKINVDSEIAAVQAQII